MLLLEPNTLVWLFFFIVKYAYNNQVRIHDVINTTAKDKINVNMPNHKE